MGIAERLAGLDGWLERQPAWLRPPIYGALIVVFLMGARGAAFTLPLLVVAVLFISKHPARDLALGAALVGAAIVGGGLAGLAYSVAGRWVRPIPTIGPYAAGVLTVAPYMAVITLIVRVSDARPLVSPIQTAEVIAFGIMSVLFGVALGQALFTEEGLR